MTQEEKKLLLKDLCARLPHGIICDMWFERNPEGKITERLKCGGLMRLMNNDFDFMAKPYLRPMSSMTEEEDKELNKLFWNNFWNSKDDYQASTSISDFCYEHHLDNHDLIPKGLALEATKGMYNTK